MNQIYFLIKLKKNPTLEEYNINFIEWPPKGADLSLIELCFGEIQQRAKQHYSNIKKQNELGDCISDIVFENDFIEFVQKCYNITIIAESVA
jgi:hypothetical protein